MLSIWGEALIASPVLLVPPVNALISKHERRDVVASVQNDCTGAKLAEIDCVVQGLIAGEDAARTLHMPSTFSKVHAIFVLACWRPGTEVAVDSKAEQGTGGLAALMDGTVAAL